MADEARSILDALMGGDRNAPLPPGMSVPRRKGKRSAPSADAPLLLPTKRTKSCFDPNVDPLYCAWGIDVYDLFVNTKSDIGPNPNIPDDTARAEYLSLPKPDQERLGFEGLLFSKLQELVRQCDRTVSRNKEKLEQEIQRNTQKLGGKTDYVQDIDEQAIHMLARLELQRMQVEEELLAVMAALEGHVTQQEEIEQNMAALEQQVKKLEVQSANDKKVKEESDDSEKKESAESVKEEEHGDVTVKKEEDSTGTTTQESEMVKNESTEESTEKKTENGTNEGDIKKTELELVKLNLEQCTQERDAIILKKQRSLFDLARKIQQYAPLQEQVESQRKQLHFVKSDITMDKTVCEVSGNFMSARDADERIAAHYAGKQYVGWKLVRDKLQAMQQQYGRYGPPRPQPPQQQSLPPRRFDDRGGGGRGGSRGGGPPPDDRYNPRAGYNSRGPPPPRGNYGGGGGGGYHNDDRGGGRDRGGGGYRGGGGGYGGGDRGGSYGGGGRRDGGRW